MKENGFSFTELVVVIAMISIVLAISTLDFHKWTVKSNVEKETREMYSDFAKLRTRSMYSNKRHRIVLRPDGYTFKSYTAAEPLTAGTEIEVKELPYQITKADGSSVSGEMIDFNTRGFTTDWGTIRVTSAGSESSVDCLKISKARTNVGKLKNGTCEAK